jgi:hypothetical protein
MLAWFEQALMIAVRVLNKAKFFKALIIATSQRLFY